MFVLHTLEYKRLILARMQMKADARGVELARAEREARQALDVEAYARAVADYREGARACTKIAKSIVRAMSDATTIGIELNTSVHESLRNDPAALAQWDRACSLGGTERGKRTTRKPAAAVTAA